MLSDSATALERKCYETFSGKRHGGCPALRNMGNGKNEFINRSSRDELAVRQEGVESATASAPMHHGVPTTRQMAKLTLSMC